MIRRNGEYTITLRDRMRNGDGTVRIEHYWDKTELKGGTRLFAKLILDPGVSIGFHDHVDEEEVFVVLSGRGAVDDGVVETEVGPGDSILTGNGGGHAVRAVGDEPLQMVAVIVQY